MVIGREAELARLRGLIDPPPADSRVLVLLGEAGMGKTVLLAAVTASAAQSGLTVLSVTGRESERDLAFAGLHQLLRPVLGRVSEVPQRQARALLGAFALSDEPVPADPLLTGMAVLTLLSTVADDGPLLVAADDIQWLDDGSLAALAFAARRLDAEPLTLLAAVRGSAPPAVFDRGFAELTLSPLSDTDAGRLLDAQPHPPRGRARTQILAEAAGNPMALVELSRVIAADPAAGRRWAAEPLRPPDRLAAIAAAQFALLPAASRDALLLAAVADTTDLSSVGLPALVSGALASANLAPAEAAGLIRVDTAGPQFTHPLVRSAIYHAVPFAERTAAHRRIAEAVRSQPDRYAWHLAAAALAPDEQVAALLEETAAQAQRRGGMMAAARALERAAELSPDAHDQARRLLDAMDLAERADQSDWIADLARRVLAVTADPAQRIVARQHAGWALAWSNRHADALAALLSAAAEAVVAGLPFSAWTCVALAANVAYQTGARDDREAVLSALARLERETGAAGELGLWIHGCLEPFQNRAAAVARLRQLAGGPVDDVATLGAAAWMLDESATAITLLRESLRQLRSAETGGSSGATLSALQWAYIDHGRWDEALAAAREAGDAADASLMPTVAASADLAVATVLALRGAHAQVQPYLDRALAAVNPAEYRGFAARAAHAAGLNALGEGQPDAAYAQLRPLFAADGTPSHHHVSYLALADLAAAAVRAYQGPQTAELAERALSQVGPAPGARLEQIAARARCLLADPADAAGTEARFTAALSGPAGDAWPFERAQLRLDYGEWLRRQRRINDAKPVLAAALEVFRHLGAEPWTQRTQAELRACGVTAPTGAGPRPALDALTAQQREIVILASRGLTNNEIADRLFLSARTVASHLHRAYGKLGLAGRHQLRGVVDDAAGDEA